MRFVLLLLLSGCPQQPVDMITIPPDAAIDAAIDADIDAEPLPDIIVPPGCEDMCTWSDPTICIEYGTCIDFRCELPDGGWERKGSCGAAPGPERI